MSWNYEQTISPPTSNTYDFGGQFSISKNGLYMAIGNKDDNESGATTGYGAVYEYNGSSWVQRGTTLTHSQQSYLSYSQDLSIDNTGTTVIISNIASTHAQGELRIWKWSGTSWSIFQTVTESGKKRFGVRCYLSTNGLAFTTTDTTIQDIVYYRFNSSTNTYEKKADVPAATNINHHMSKDGLCVVLGDGGTTSANTCRIYEYDVSTDTWTQKGSSIISISNGDYSHRRSICENKNICALGGFNVTRIFEYDSSTQLWVQKGSDLPGITNGYKTLVHASPTCFNSTGTQFALIRSLYKWDGSTNDWVVINSLHGTYDVLGMSVDANVIALSNSSAVSNYPGSSKNYTVDIWMNMSTAAAPSYNVPDSSTITNAISGSTATLSTISTDDLTDTAVVGTTTTAQRSYTKNLLASLITNYTTALSGKKLKLSGITLPGFENSGDKDIIVVSTAAGSTLDNTVSKSEITSNNVYAVIEENESISLPTHTSTLTVAKTGATTYDITYNGTTTVSNTGDTITQDGLTVILGSVMANLSVQNVDLLFTNHLAESITSAAATIPGFTTTMTADATVECTGPAATVFQNTFYFKTDSDIATTSTDDVHYYVDLSSWTTVAADLNASTNGTISLGNGAFVDGESISESFLRHLANTLFGTHLGVDLFNNETTVKADLLTSTATLATTIQTAISDISVSGSDGDLLGSAGDKYLDDNTTSTKNITREMINQLLNNPNSRERFNASNLANYIKGGEAGCYSVPFLPDDTISYKVTINPNGTQDTDVPVGPNTTSRSFRVKIKLT